jgi:hypothetical protein
MPSSRFHAMSVAAAQAGLAQRVAQLISRAGPRSHPVAPVAPRFAVTATAGGGPSRPWALGEHVLSHAGSPTDLRPLLLSAGPDDRNRVVILPFAPDGREPLGVMKLVRMPSLNEHVEQEQA